MVFGAPIFAPYAPWVIRAQAMSAVRRVQRVDQCDGDETVGVLRESRGDTESDQRGGQAMTRLRRASVIAALSLLAWAATASAECAWVI